MGLGMYLPDSTGLIRSDNMIRRAVADRIRTDSIEEEMRMLYVALTRARNRLVVTAKVKDPEKVLSESEWDAAFADEWSVSRSGSYLDWILQACALCRNNKPYEITIVDPEEENSDETKDVCEEALTIEEQIDERISAMEAQFGHRYSWDYLIDIPSKLTVSRLNPEILDEYEVNTDKERCEAEESENEQKRPKFMSGKDDENGRERGNATHKFLQFVRFDALKEYGYETELNRLIGEGFLSEKEAGLINLQHVSRFERSLLLDKILRSSFVKREFRFNHRMPAADFTENEEKRRNLEDNNIKITVQGVVDCVYRDPDTGKLVLVDYKTDSLTLEEWRDQAKAEEKLLNRHRNQLLYYGKICEELFCEKIDRVYIYSTVLGRLIRI